MSKVRKRITTAGLIILILIIGWRVIPPVPGTYHFSGTGDNFGAGVNTTVGFLSFKDIELVIYSKTPRGITGIKYELKGRFALKSSGLVSLGSDGYYFGSLREGNIPINISRFDVVTLTLEWKNQKEILKLYNKD